MKYFYTLLLIIVIISPFRDVALAEIDTSYIGFVNASLWFDKELFFSGDKVRIYTTLANSTEADFKGTVEFFDNKNFIGSSSVTLERQGGFQVVWVDWVPTEGEHIVSVSITNPIIITEDGEQALSYDSEPSYEISRFVDTDTDGDLIGNTIDIDDDNDGILDVDDEEPLIARKIANPQEDIPEETKEIIETLKEVASSTTPKIIAGIESVKNTLDNFRKETGKVITKQIQEVKEKIAEKITNEESNNNTENKELKNSPFNQLKLLALTTAGYTLNNTVVFYLVLAFGVYLFLFKTLPWVIRRFRSNKNDI